MFKGILFVAFLFAGIVLGILYNKFRVSNYPENKRKSGYFLAVLIFVGASLSVYIVTSIKSYLNSTVTNYSVTVEKYFDEKFSDNEIVKNGVSINQLNEILVHIDNGKAMIVSIMPSEKEFGVGKFAYGIIVDYVGDYIDSYVSSIKKDISGAMNKYANVILAFSDKNGNITVSSIISALKNNLLNRINKILLVIIILVNIPFYIYIIITIILKIKIYRKKEVQEIQTPVASE
jgi:hypothetical protein